MGKRQKEVSLFGQVGSLIIRQRYVESVPIKNHLAQKILNKQRKNEYLKKKKITRREIEKVLDGLSNNDQYLHNKLLQLDNLFGLYLEYSKETEKFSEFVKARTEEFEQKQSEHKKGT